jgi:hypothetical protein
LLSRAAEEVAVPLERIHLCCEDCVEGVQRAVISAGATGLETDQGNNTVIVYAPDNATAQRAVNAMVAAGFFGISKNPDVKVTADTGAKDAKVTSTEIEGVHLCCETCTESVKDAVTSVPGVKSLTATVGANGFKILGDFNEKGVLDALLAAGFSAKVTK